jgi:hypothetical protein
MTLRRSAQIVIFVGLGFVAFGLPGSAQQQDRPGLHSATAKARRDAAKAVYEGSWQHHIQDPGDGPDDGHYYHEWSVRWMQAERDLSRTRAEDITALEEHLKRMEFHKDLAAQSVKAAGAPAYAASAAEFFRLEAEDWLREAKVAAK